MTRRSAFSLLVTGASLIVASVVGIPALLTGLSPVIRKGGGPTWRSLGQVQDFAVGLVQERLISPDRGGWPRTFRELVVFVWRPSETEFVVFSRRCTDLGCSLEYEEGSACYFCPCHGGIFTQDGQRLAGPPDRPMFRYTHRVREGMVEIDLSSVPPGV
jgi:menaquinol-cytochrome c reductase iron-sulfur subunit